MIVVEWFMDVPWHFPCILVENSNVKSQEDRIAKIPMPLLHPRQAMFCFRNMLHFQQLGNTFQNPYSNKWVGPLSFRDVALTSLECRHC
jgi:hypothetical protein